MAGLRGRILITGGTGFLGRGILRAAKRDGWDASFTILSRDEEKQARARRAYPEATYVLGDVLDVQRLSLLMIGHDYVIHAAALKFIPEGEFNASEVVRVNIDGARSVMDAARSAGVKRVIGISTDKAAQPINVYGMTKAVMERLFAESRTGDYTTFTTCRYGNVIGSTGSVVPVLREQFEEHGYVTITDPHMTRFWMPIDDAVAVVLRAAEATPGSVKIPDPRSASMQAIAHAVLKSLGQPYTFSGGDFDPRIRVIGKRPGEKQHEDLISHYELYRTTFDATVGDYELMPPGNEDYTNEMPTLSSNAARTVDWELLADWIKDSVTV